jgi:hypothetical protein
MMIVPKLDGRPNSQLAHVDACIRRYSVIKKGVITVITDVREDIDLQNLMQHLNSDSHKKQPIPFQINDAVRLKMRIKETTEEPKGRKMGVRGVDGSMFDI